MHPCVGGVQYVSLLGPNHAACAHAWRHDTWATLTACNWMQPGYLQLVQVQCGGRDCDAQPMRMDR